MTFSGIQLGGQNALSQILSQKGQADFSMPIQQIGLAGNLMNNMYGNRLNQENMANQNQQPNFMDYLGMILPSLARVGAAAAMPGMAKPV